MSAIRGQSSRNRFESGDRRAKPPHVRRALAVVGSASFRQLATPVCARMRFSGTTAVTTIFQAPASGGSVTEAACDSSGGVFLAGVSDCVQVDRIGLAIPAVSEGGLVTLQLLIPTAGTIEYRKRRVVTMVTRMPKRDLLHLSGRFSYTRVDSSIRQACENRVTSPGQLLTFLSRVTRSWEAVVCHGVSGVGGLFDVKSGG